MKLGDDLNAAGYKILSPGAPLGAPTLANATASGETVVARWPIPANWLSTAWPVGFTVVGQITANGSATLIVRVRIGTAGTTSDAVACTMGTSAASALNRPLRIDGELWTSTTGASGTCDATGYYVFGTAISGLAAASFSATSVDTTVANYLSVTVEQSASQTLTIRRGHAGRML